MCTLPWRRMMTAGTANKAIPCRRGGQCSDVTRKPRVERTVRVPAGQVQEAVVRGRLTEDVTVSLAVSLQDGRAG